MGMSGCWWARTARRCRSATAAPACRNFASAAFCAPPCSIICFVWATPSDVDGWLPAREMPAHFRPEHLGRAPARFEESQLIHWQKETLQRMSAAEIGAWLGSEDIDCLRRTRTPQRGAAGGCGAMDGRGARRAAAAGATNGASSTRRATNFSRRPPQALDAGGPRPESAHEDIEGAYRAQGRGSIHAAAGRTDRPEHTVRNLRRC